MSALSRSTAPQCPVYAVDTGIETSQERKGRIMAPSVLVTLAEVHEPPEDSSIDKCLRNTGHNPDLLPSTRLSFLQLLKAKIQSFSLLLSKPRILLN